MFIENIIKLKDLINIIERSEPEAQTVDELAKLNEELANLIAAIDILKNRINASFNKNLFIKIIDLKLSVRADNALRYNSSMVYLGDITKQTRQQLLCIPNFGYKSLKEIEDIRLTNLVNG